MGDYSLPVWHQAAELVFAVKRIFSLPCATTPSVYVEAAQQGLYRAAFSLFSPDPRHVYHQALGRSISHELKNTLAEAEVVSPTDKPAATRALFEFADAIDIASWYFFIFSAVADGAMAGQTQLYKGARCDKRDSPDIGNGTDPFGAISDDGRIGGVDYVFQKPSKFFPAGPPAATMAPGFPGSVSQSVQFGDFNGIPVGCSSFIFSDETNQTLDFDSTGADPNSKLRRAHVWFDGQISNGGNVGMEAENQYIGPPLPLGECFPQQDGICFRFSIL